jgi:mannose-6-phosphate isomerase-like protein (cupin superfamily)
MIKQRPDMSTEVRENMRGGDGSVTITHYFAKDELTANCRLCSKLLLPPGAGIGSHQHDGEDEVYIVEQGSGLLNDGNTETRVSAGDAILTGNGESHAIRNDGDEDLVLTAIIMCY